MIEYLDEDSVETPRATTSLDKRLPLTISALLAVTIALFGILAFSEVRRTTTSAITTQLRTVLGQAVDNSARGVATRLAELKRLANDSNVAAAFALPATDAALQNTRGCVRSRLSSADSVTMQSQWLLDPSGSARLLLGSNPRRWNGPWLTPCSVLHPSAIAPRSARSS